MNSQTATRLYDDSPAWQALARHAGVMSSISITDMSHGDPERSRRLIHAAGPLTVDMTLQKMSGETLELLLALARERDLSGWTERLFAGAPLNVSEATAAMHWALRMDEDDPDPAGVFPLVREQLGRMETIAGKLRDGLWLGFDGQQIRDVICLGAGGSRLGPMTAVTALQSEGDTYPRVHFASAMDGLQLARLLAHLTPATTLFVVASKSFNTPDTMDNAEMARDWLTAAGATPVDIANRHFIGISAHPRRMHDWGIAQSNQLKLWDWVGGRYSLCSAIGLPVMIASGAAAFNELLAGARFMDRHFRLTEWRGNLPVLLALNDVWNRNFLGINTRAVLPYDTRLGHLPAYVEQLEMESCGKSVTRDGQPVHTRTAPVVWGGLGVDAEHAFYQFLHQGTEPVACDFLVAKRPPRNVDPVLAPHMERQHRRTLANCRASARALAFGDAVPGVTPSTCPQRRQEGNRPSTTLVLEDITPFTLGALTAMYEHRVFVQSVIWRINPFDQWGIELGKQLTQKAVQLSGAGAWPQCAVPRPDKDHD